MNQFFLYLRGINHFFHTEVFFVIPSLCLAQVFHILICFRHCSVLGLGFPTSVKKSETSSKTNGTSLKTFLLKWENLWLHCETQTDACFSVTYTVAKWLGRRHLVDFNPSSVSFLKL